MRYFLMATYLRARVDGATFFFTLNLADRRRRLLVDHIDVLRGAFAETKALLPFRIDAIVILPEHLHCMWTLPRTDSDYSERWRRIKRSFSMALRSARAPDTPCDNDSAVWQPRFWEHVIRNDADYDAHMDYIHYNPVKHGHVRRTADWPYSSFHRCVAAGLYPVT